MGPGKGAGPGPSRQKEEVKARSHRKAEQRGLFTQRGQSRAGPRGSCRSQNPAGRRGGGGRGAVRTQGGAALGAGRWEFREAPPGCIVAQQSRLVLHPCETAWEPRERSSKLTAHKVPRERQTRPGNHTVQSLGSLLCAQSFHFCFFFFFFLFLSQLAIRCSKQKSPPFRLTHVEVPFLVQWSNASHCPRLHLMYLGPTESRGSSGGGLPSSSASSGCGTRQAPEPGRVTGP